MACGDRAVTADGEHLKSRWMDYVYEDFLAQCSEYDVVISDSCTCTSDPNPDHPDDKYYNLKP